MSDPSYPDTPWWSNLLAVLITAVVSVLGTLYATRPRAPGEPSTPPVFLSFFKDTLTYIPHILLLFGVLADMFTYQGVYSIPSLVGLLSIPLNWVMQFFWTGTLGVVNQLAAILQNRSRNACRDSSHSSRDAGRWWNNWRVLPRL